MNAPAKSRSSKTLALLLSGPLLVVTLGGAAQAAWLTVDAFKYSDPAFETSIQVNVAGVAGVTGVDAVSAGGTALSLSLLNVDHYGATFGPFGNFASFFGATAGAWKIRIHFGASGSVIYDFPVSGFGTPGVDPFPPVPTMISPTDGATGVNPTPTFSWNNGGTHGGALESLFVNVYSLVNPAVGQFENSFGAIGLNDMAWTPSVVLPPGAAMFLVQYETNENEDARVGLPVFNPVTSTRSDPLIAWEFHSGDLFSRDLITFTVGRLVIVSIVRHVDDLQLEIAAPLAMGVGIEYSPDLSVGSWIPLGDVAMSGGSGTFTDRDPGRLGLPQGFYRAVAR
jgi:hypothetical protein